MSFFERKYFLFPCFSVFLSLLCLCFAFSVRLRTPRGPGLFAQVTRALGRGCMVRWGWQSLRSMLSLGWLKNSWSSLDCRICVGCLIFTERPVWFLTILKLRKDWGTQDPFILVVWNPHIYILDLSSWGVRGSAGVWGRVAGPKPAWSYEGCWRA